MDRSSFQQRAGNRDAEIESLKKECDRLRQRLDETRERFRQFTRTSGQFATSMRGMMGERRRLELHHNVLDALRSATDLEEATSRALAILGGELGQTLGVFWTSEGDSLRCSSTWRPEGAPHGVLEEELERLCRDTSFLLHERNGNAPGPELPVRALGEGRAVWTRDLEEVRALMAQDTLREEVISLAFPVADGGGFVGVVELFGRDDGPPDEGLLRTLTVLGQQVAQAVENRRAGEALRESEERFRQFAENSEDVLWILDAESGQLEYLSPAYERVWGEPRSVVLRDLERWKELVHPEDRERAGEGMTRLLGGEAFSQEYRIVRPEDGEERWILDAGFPIAYDSGRIKRVAGIAQDITIRRRAEEERGRLQALEAGIRAQRAERRRISRDLHDRVAHDMAVAHQSLQLYEALKVTNAGWADEKLALARQTVRTALDATRNLSAELRRPAAEESLKDALHDFLEAYVPEEMDTAFLFNGDESCVPDQVRGQLYLVVREAVRNAVKHSGCHHLEVRVDVGNGSVSVSVGDNGCGFDLDWEHEGVGLTSMRERLDLLDGELHLASDTNGGTKVDISVPLAGVREELHGHGT